MQVYHTRTSTHNKRSVRIWYELNSTKGILIGVWLMVTLLVFIQVYILQMQANSGQRLAQLTQMQGQLTLENDILKAKIADQSSLRVIEQKAKALGFTDQRKVEMYH